MRRGIILLNGEPFQDQIDDKDALTVNAATNKFTEMNEHFVEYTQAAAGKATNFTRADFGASYPTAPKGGDLVATESMMANFDMYTADYYDSADTAPTTGADNNITASALRGVPAAGIPAVQAARAVRRIAAVRQLKNLFMNHVEPT